MQLPPATPIAAAACITLIAGCEEPAADPPLPRQLVSHEELPFGDIVTAKMHRAMIAGYDRYEPKYGHLKSQTYSIAARDIAGARDELVRHMPSGWTRLEGPPLDHATMDAYAAGKRMFVMIIVDAGVDPQPVAILRNEEK